MIFPASLVSGGGFLFSAEGLTLGETLPNTPGLCLVPMPAPAVLPLWATFAASMQHQLCEISEYRLSVLVNADLPWQTAAGSQGPTGPHANSRTAQNLEVSPVPTKSGTDTQH